MRIYSRGNRIDFDSPQKPRKLNWLWIIILLALSFSGYFFFRDSKEEIGENSAKEETKKTEEAREVKADSQWKKTDTYVISEGDLPADVFVEHAKFNANDVASLLEDGKETYDFSQLKIGQELHFYFNEDEKAKKIEYDINTEEMIIAEKEGNGFKVERKKIPYETRTETLAVKIDEFLYKDALDAGLSEATVLEIADIFSFDIDFTTEIREGDEFKVVYEKRTLEGKPAPDGRVLAAKFVNAGQEYFGYYFDDGQGDGGSHYDGEGHELMRQFLRAPLSYRRITSGYTGARMHPITKTVSAHYQIDYAAPTGTPVVATARGTVASAGFEGGWGNIVRLTHDNGYTTHYGHLSAFAKGMKSGASVSQGQVVGYVGSTGWSTGPHLDYGMRLNGAPVNPMSLKLPKGNPLLGDKKGEFEETKRKYDEMLK